MTGSNATTRKATKGLELTALYIFINIHDKYIEKQVTDSNTLLDLTVRPRQRSQSTDVLTFSTLCL